MSYVAPAVPFKLIIVDRLEIVRPPPVQAQPWLPAELQAAVAEHESRVGALLTRAERYDSALTAFELAKAHGQTYAGEYLPTRQSRSEIVSELVELCEQQQRLAVDVSEHAQRRAAKLRSELEQALADVTAGLKRGAPLLRPDELTRVANRAPEIARLKAELRVAERTGHKSEPSRPDALRALDRARHLTVSTL